VVLSFLYRVVYRTFGVLGFAKRDTFAKDAEILVLRHQLAVLRRQVGRPRFTWSDRTLIALLAGLIPRQRWTAFVATPKTILDWHRRLVSRRWTYPHRRPGRPPLEQDTVEPSPLRSGPTWAEFLAAQVKDLMACDFIHVETVFPRRLSCASLVRHSSISTQAHGGLRVALASVGKEAGWLRCRSKELTSWWH